MITIESSELVEVTGGVWRGDSREQISERYRQICTLPSRSEARHQYDKMVTQMVPDSSEKAGFKRRTVTAIGQLCHWPLPPK